MVRKHARNTSGNQAPNDILVQPSEWERVLTQGLGALRKARGWTQNDLARRSGLHRRTIWLLEHPNTEKPQPSQQTIKALARAFGYIHMSDLWSALQTTMAIDTETPLIVGERVRRMVLAFLDCTPQQQQCIEGLILWWSARRQAEALDQADVLDIALLVCDKEKCGLTSSEDGAHVEGVTP